MNAPGQGRPRTPPELHVARGTWRKDRHGDPDVVPLAPKLARPPCPQELVELYPEADATWGWVCDRMEEAGLPYAAAAIPMLNLVVSLLKYHKEMAVEATSGTVLVSQLRDGRKEVKVSPHFKTMRQLRSDLARYSKDLGLDPSARARMLAAIGGAKTDETKTDLAVRKRSS